MSIEDRLVRWLNRPSTRRPERSHRGIYIGPSHRLVGHQEGHCLWPWSPAQHTFVCGRTGKGKTTLLLRLMDEHLRAGQPFLFIDFHGHATEHVLALAATNLSSQIVLLEPWSDPVIGWNPLDAEPVALYATIQELISVFHHRLWPDAWGPRLEELLRNTLLALAEADLTLLEASTFLTDESFRRPILQQVTLSEVREFWTMRFPRITPSQRSLVTETVLNKLSVFTDPILKYVVGQRAGRLDFDRALAEGQTVLVDLSGGQMRGNNYLLASLLVAKLKSAVYRRSATAKGHSIILDEFQEMVTSDTLDDYLRSFRKFGCSVYLATQHLQLAPELKASIFANCSRFCCFATSAGDAAFLGREFGLPDGDLVTERLPELRTGQAMVKVRGEATELVRVISPETTVDVTQVAEGRMRCLQLGLSRQAIDAEARARLESFNRPKGKRAKRSVPVTDPQPNEELAEGYDDV